MHYEYGYRTWLEHGYKCFVTRDIDRNLGPCTLSSICGCYGGPKNVASKIYAIRYYVNTIYLEGLHNTQILNLMCKNLHSSKYHLDKSHKKLI